MRADILTKGFLDTDKWRHALMLINHVDPKTFWRFNPKEEVIKIGCTDAPKAGGTTKGLDEVATPAASPNKMAMPTSVEQFPLPKKDRRRLHWLVSKVTWQKERRESQ